MSAFYTNFKNFLGEHYCKSGHALLDCPVSYMLHIINPISDTSYNYRGVASSQGGFYFLSKNNISIIMAMQLGPWIIDRVAAHQRYQLQVRGVPLYYIIHCSSMHLQVSSASSSDSEELSSPMTIPTPSWRTGRPLMLDTRIRS